MRVLIQFFAALSAALSLTPPDCAAQAPSPTEQARFLAGLPVRGSLLEEYTRGSMWGEHAAALDAAWDRAEQRQMGRVRAWSGNYLSGNGGPVYYMFSGPDFLYANLFFRMRQLTFFAAPSRSEVSRILHGFHRRCSPPRWRTCGGQ